MYIIFHTDIYKIQQNMKDEKKIVPCFKNIYTKIKAKIINPNAHTFSYKIIMQSPELFGAG